MLPICTWCVAIPWFINNLLAGTVFKGDWLSPFTVMSSSKRMGIVGPSSIHVEILTGLISCRCYTGIPHYCELIWAVAMPYLEVRNPKISFWYTSLYLKFPEPGMMEGWHRWTIYNWVLKILCNCYFDQLWISAWITAHYKKKCLWSKLRAKQV